MSNDIAIIFGKMNPPTLAHHALGAALMDYAKQRGIDHAIYASQKHLKPTKTKIAHEGTPLSPEQKLTHLKRYFGDSSNVQLHVSPYHAIDELLAKGHTRVHVMLGSDRVDDTGPGLKEKYGDKVVIVPFGEKREKGGKGIKSVSSTIMREHARNNDYDKFKELVPSHISDEHAKELFGHVRSGLKLAKVKIQENISMINNVITGFMKNYLSEATKLKSKKVNRQEPDHAQKAQRRRQNTNTQREVRGKHDQAIKAGDVKGNVFVVKNKKGEVEIVDKKSIRKDHTVLVDADTASMSTLKSYLKNPAFSNTKTSIDLFGLQKDAGGEKEAKKEKKKSSSSSSSTKSAAAKAMEPQQQLVPAVKKASKKDTFPTTHGATEMESGIAFAVNTALGLSPEKMVSMGLIDKKEVDAVMKNQNASFMPSCQRAAQQIVKQFGGLYVKHTGRLKSTTKLSPEAIEGGVKDTTPKSDLLLVDKDGKVVAGLSQKIGESQLSSGGPAETAVNLKWAMEQVGDKMDPSTRKEAENFIKFFENDLGGNPRTKQGPVSLYQQGAEKAGQDKEVERREKLHDKATEMLDKILNGDKKLASAFIFSLITGSGKFKQGDPAIATHIMSANRDGTDLKMTPVDMKYAEKLVDKVKFQMKFKSSAVETTDVKKKWEEFKEHKKKLGQKISLNEDFRSYSFRSVIRAYLMESINYLNINRLIKVLTESENSELKQSTPPEPKTPDEAVQYLKDAFDYIGDDYFKLTQFFEDSIDPDVTQPIVDWPELAESGGSTKNTVVINGKKFEIPVEDPYNYTPGGNMESPLSEEYLEEKKKRNYKQEYERYHSRPEQRKNRSKRVLARRLMMKLGKVHKGDGKDVDHKDGNPQNNGKHNLRVRDKSENRADN